MLKIGFPISLRNPIFRQLYLAQTVSLFGDALTWLGLALLAFELAGKSAPVVLAGALTLRVAAFTLLSPLAGVLADRCDRQPILMFTHLGRMLLVCLLPFVQSIWQIYALVLGLNILNAFFAPTYQATIPLVTGETDYRQAIALSGTTYQILGVFGPGLAGVLALFIGARDLFFWDGVSFLVAAILIATLPANLRFTYGNATRTDVTAAPQRQVGSIGADVVAGTAQLWADAPLRYGLMLQLVTSIAGAQILVNTVGYVQGTLRQTAVEYGWVMMGFGLGATLGTIVIGIFPQYRSQIPTLLAGGIAINAALLGANYVGLVPLILLWAIAGCGQSIINLSLQTLIAERTPTTMQGRVYGAHFAWSHLWWAGAYPLAGWLGTSFPDRTFGYGSLIGLVVLAIVHLYLSPDRFTHTHPEFAHTHSDDYLTVRWRERDRQHQHIHFPDAESEERWEHQHLHIHPQVSHSHSYTDISHQHQHS